MARRIQTSLSGQSRNTSVLSPSEPMEKQEVSLRPKGFDGFIGQSKLKERLGISICSAKERNDSLDHVLFYGSAGLGKTTLAGIIANEMDSDLTVVTSPSIERVADLMNILTKRKDGDILFFDEIHRLPAAVEESLYSAMEDNKLYIHIGKGAESKTISMELPKFTLIGATTRSGMLSKPLKDRFGIVEHLDYYADEELSEIILRNAEKLSVPLKKEGALILAKCSRGTPRIANRLLKRARDYHVAKKKDLNKAEIHSLLSLLGISKDGLTNEDREYLKAIKDLGNGKPVGLNTLASSLLMDAQTIEEDIESYLLYKKMIAKTPRGRILTA